MLHPAANLSKTYEIWLTATVPRSPSLDADGRWPMADGQWPMAYARWPMPDGRWPMPDGRGRSANQSQVAPHFDQPECSSPCSRQSTIGRCPEVDEFSTSCVLKLNAAHVLRIFINIFKCTPPFGSSHQNHVPFVLVLPCTLPSHILLIATY